MERVPHNHKHNDDRFMTPQGRPRLTAALGLKTLIKTKTVPIM